MNDLGTILQGVAALAATAGTTVIGILRYRKKNEDNRYQREQAAITAAQKAATDARSEEQATRALLMQEKDATISRLELALRQEHDENQQLQMQLFPRPTLGGAHERQSE